MYTGVHTYIHILTVSVGVSECSVTSFSYLLRIFGYKMADMLVFTCQPEIFLFYNIFYTVCNGPVHPYPEWHPLVIYARVV